MVSRHQKIQESLRQGNSITKVSIPSFHIADDIVVYEVDVSNKKLRWNLWLRYEFFHILNQMMKDIIAELPLSDNTVSLPPFPEKKIKFLVNHFDEYFIEERRMLLENYLQKLLANKSLKNSEVFISFLTPPENEELDSLTTDKSNQNDKDKLNHTNSNSSIKKKLISTNNEADSEKKLEETKENNESDNTDNTTSSPNNNNNNNNKSKIHKKSMDESSEIDNTKLVDEDLIDIDQDDEITGVSIPQAQILKNDHTIYQIHVTNSNKRKSYSEWTVLKRFGEFCAFDQTLRSSITHDFPDELDKLPTLPPKHFKIIIDHLDETFIEKRRLLLQCYLRRLIKYKLFRRHELTIKFFGVS